MKLIKAAKHALLFILYFTINTLFFFFLKFFSVNQHQNYSQIFVIIIFCAFYVAAIVYRNSDPHTLTDEISTLVKEEVSAIPFLDWYVYFSPTVIFSLHDRGTMQNVENVFRNRDDEFFPPPLVYLECKSTEYDHEGYDHNLAVAGLCNYDHECGYEGDNEDNGDYEDDDFNKNIEEFIAVKKREWREEIIRERLLCIEAAKF